MKAILTILKKELKRFFTDKRTLFAIIMPGVILFIMYSLMGTIIQEAVTNATKDSEYIVYMENEPAEFKNFLVNPDLKIKYLDSKPADYLTDIKNKKLDMYVIFDADFMTKIESYDVKSGEVAPEVKIYYNSSKEESSTLFAYYISCLNTYESTINNKFDINRDTNTKFDLATKEDTSIQIITMLMPFLLVLMLFSSTMAFCAESIAGEKERGTIATLLATPVKRYQIAIGKILSLGVVSLTSAIVTSLSLFASLPRLAGTAEISLSIYGLGSILMIFMVILVTVLLFATLLALISTYAKSVKEASALSMPLMVIVMASSMVNMMSTKANTNLIAYLIPVYNSIQCLTSIFSKNVNYLAFGIAIISNIVYISLGVFVVAKLFNNEKVMFNK